QDWRRRQLRGGSFHGPGRPVPWGATATSRSTGTAPSSPARASSLWSSDGFPSDAWQTRWQGDEVTGTPLSLVTLSPFQAFRGRYHSLTAVNPTSSASPSPRTHPFPRSRGCSSAAPESPGEASTAAAGGWLTQRGSEGEVSLPRDFTVAAVARWGDCSTRGKT